VSGLLANTYLQGGVSARGLTARQRDVLKLIAEGKRAKDIAEVLGVSSKSAESQRARLMTKLDIHDTPGLVRYAIRSGLSKL
jgi:DNA-binding CsgD family transcriptional regulator